MKFFFPDAHDLVDPTFDYQRERRALGGSRQQSQLYAHEYLDKPPYDGMLLSKAMVDSNTSSKGVRYSFSQVQRLKRNGIREFLRLDNPRFTKRLETLGDCGSFSYITENEPPFGVESVIEFYSECGFDYGISLDHVILGFRGESECKQPIPDAWTYRYKLTLELANQFFARTGRKEYGFVPVGTAQGWSSASYKNAVEQLQLMGYDYIALGGMVPLKTHEILSSLEAINGVRKPNTKLHLLGISRLDNLSEFTKYGVYSFDSTSPLKRAFMDNKDNYHTLNGHFTAIRIPQVDGNPQLKKLILAGIVDFNAARKLETACLEGVKEYESGRLSIDYLIERLTEYEILWHGKKDDGDKYRATLEAAPWKKCLCSVCQKLGIQVVIFRGAERNRSRGFHNLHVLRQQIDQHSKQ
jgi:hypothetical protein